MINEFTRTHPEAHVVVADVREYRDAASYDLIFSSQMVQYLDEEGFARWLDNAVAMLAADGCIITASVPWRPLRRRYLANDFSSPRPNLAGRAYGVAAGLAKNTIGRWYSFADFDRLGARYGLHSELFGSVCYPYRCHVRMTRRREAAAS